MQDRWLRKGPALDEVVSERVDRRKGRKETAIVITTYGNQALLREHLRALEKQSSGDFDVIIVYGERDVVAESTLPILHIKERGRNGSSGAYYIGEKTALDEGYGIVMLADDDCMPESPNLVKSLAESARSGNKIVMPMLHKRDRGMKKTSIPHYYGTFSREVLEDAGLTYFPLFFGGEDVELMYRMVRAGYSAMHIEAAVIHPDIVPFFLDASLKRYYYTRGEFEALIVRGSIAEPFAFFAFHSIASAALFTIGRGDIAHRTICGLLDGALLRFYANDSLAAGGRVAEEAEGGWDVVFEPEGWKYVTPNMVLHKGGLAWMQLAYLAVQLLGTVALMPRYFRKKVLFRGMSSPLSLTLMLAARSAFVEFEGKPRKVFEGRGVISILLGILIMAIALPASVVLALPLVSLGHINRLLKGASSKSYGL